MTKRTLASQRATAQKPNMTARYLELRLQKTNLFDRLTLAITNRMPISARTSQVDDHIQNFFNRLIRRDALRNAILSGETIPDTKLLLYAVRSARTDVRDSGREPVCRDLYGAKAEHERRTGPRPELTARTKFNDGLVRTWDQDGMAVMVEIPDYSDVALEDRLHFESIWKRAVAILKRKKPKAWRRYVEVLRMKYEGYSTKDIAQVQGVSRHRAAGLTATLRETMHEAANEGRFDSVLQQQ